MKPINAIHRVSGKEEKVKIVAFLYGAHSDDDYYEPLAVFINETQHLESAPIHRFHQCQLSDLQMNVAMACEEERKVPPRQNDSLLREPPPKPKAIVLDCPTCGLGSRDSYYSVPCPVCNHPTGHFCA